MILRSLSLKNVKCFDEAEVSFVEGKNVIIGQNGSGKSTLLQSILYSMYAVYPQGTNDQLVRTGANTAEIELEFEHAGQEYLVERKIRPHSTPEAYLTNKRETDPRSATQTGVTDDISDMLQMKKEVFRDVILVRQGEIARIIEMDRTERKETFDRLLGLYDYEQAHRNCVRIKNLLEGKTQKSEELMAAYKASAQKLVERKTRLDGLKEALRSNRNRLRTLSGKLTGVESSWRTMEGLAKEIATLEISIEKRTETLERDRKEAQKHERDVSRLCTGLALPVPKQFTVKSLELLTSKSEKELALVKSEVEGARQEHTTYTEKRSALEGYRTRAEETSAAVEELQSAVDDAVDIVIAASPELADKPQQEWVERLGVELKDRQAREQEVARLLESAAQVRSRAEKVSEKKSMLGNQVSSLVKDLADNSSRATAEAGKDWGQLAIVDMAELGRRIRKVSSDTTGAESDYEQLTKDAAREETKENRLEKELAELSGLVGKKCPKCKQVVSDKHARELSSDIRSELKALRDGLKILKARVGAAKELVSSLRVQQKELEKERDLVGRLRIYHEEAETIERRLAKAKADLKTLAGEAEGLASQLEGMDVKDLEDEQQSLLLLIGSLTEAKRAAQTVTKESPRLQEKRGKLEGLTHTVSELEGLSLDAAIDELETRIGSLEDRSGELVSLAGSIDRLSSLIAQMDSLDKVVETDRQSYRQLRGQYDSKQHAQLTIEREKVQKEVASVKKHVELLVDEQIPLAKEQYDESKNAADSISSLSAEHERARKALDVLTKLREFYREVQRPLRRRDLERASRHASEIFRTLIGSNEFDRIRITEDHDLQVSRLGELEPMSMLSGGEQVLASLAVRLGFARALASSDLLMLDEPTAYLDDQRKAELVDTLYRVSPAKQMLIVTHDDEFQRVAQRVIHVEKDESSLMSSVSWAE